MPNLKLIAMRLKSVKNIQKITQSMKMVSAAKFAKAERDLKAARPLGLAAQQFYKSAEISSDNPQPKELLVAITSDRGLAGAVHSNINKAIRAKFEAKIAAGESLDNVKVLCVGDKSRAFFQRFFPKQILMVGGEIGRAHAELQSHSDLVCRLLLEKKKKTNKNKKLSATKVNLHVLGIYATLIAAY